MEENILDNFEQESPVARQANLAFRKEVRAREGTEAWIAYNAEVDATRLLTAKLREERLIRESNALAHVPELKHRKKPTSRGTRST